MSRVTTLRRGQPRRVAMLSVHTSPLDQPGSGDAGGLNVYVVELSRRLAALGVQVEVFTRATSAALPPVVPLADGVLVRHVPAGPYEGLGKDDLPAQLCAFTAGVLRVEAAHDRGYFDLVHSHYWLSGQVGWLAQERWGVPLVHTSHTLAKVKNLALAEGDEPEPAVREIGELQVVQAADRLVASTAEEAAALVDLYDADPARVATVAPGVNLDTFGPGDRAAALRRLGLPADAVVLAFVGRIQPLKAPDVLIGAAAHLLADRALPAEVRERLRVVVVGGLSGRATGGAGHLPALAAELGIADRVEFRDPLPQSDLADVYRAAAATVVPSYNESFGLVALESQACGTPVVAAAVGGLRRAVDDGVSGFLVEGHDPRDYAAALAPVLSSPGLAARLSTGALAHARGFGWEVTAAEMLHVYDTAPRERRAVPARAALA